MKTISLSLAAMTILLAVVSARPLPTTPRLEQPPSDTSLIAVQKRDALPLGTGAGSGLSAEDYIAAHEAADVMNMGDSAPVTESNMVKGLALTRRSMQEVDVSKMHLIQPMGAGQVASSTDPVGQGENLGPEGRLREAVYMPPTALE